MGRSGYDNSLDKFGVAVKHDHDNEVAAIEKARAEELAKEAKKLLAKEKKKEQTKLNKLKKQATTASNSSNSKIEVKTETSDDGTIDPRLIMRN